MLALSSNFYSLDNETLQNIVLAINLRLKKAWDGVHLLKHFWCCTWLDNLVRLFLLKYSNSLPVFLEEFAAGGGVVSVALDIEADASSCVGESVVEDVCCGAALLDEGVADKGYTES